MTMKPGSDPGSKVGSENFERRQRVTTTVVPKLTRW